KELRQHSVVPRSLRSVRTSRRTVATLLAATLLCLMAGGGGSVVTHAAADNPIVLENQQPGSSGWYWAFPFPNDTTGQIKGYASATSVLPNENVTFYVSVNPAQTYTMDFYRFGWYGGQGARLRLHVGPLDGVQQPPCAPDPTMGTISCNWAASYTLTVPTDWT